MVCSPYWRMKTLFSFDRFFHAVLVHVDVLYNILQKKNRGSVERWASPEELFQLQYWTERQADQSRHPSASKARFQKAWPLMSFELINPELFSQFKAVSPKTAGFCMWAFPNDLQRETKEWTGGDLQQCKFAGLLAAVTLQKTSKNPETGADSHHNPDDISRIREVL